MAESVEITSVSDEKVEFILRGVDTAYANALRRVMITEIPTLAIDLVTVVENSSPLHDEFLVHRLGLIPIDSKHARNYNYRSDCECHNGCDDCMVTYILDVTCSDQDSMTITHHDLKPRAPEGGVSGVPMPMPPPSSALRGEGFFQGTPLPGIILAKLARHQSIKMECEAVKGTAKIHSKWSPVATAVYQFEADIIVNQARQNRMTRDQKARFVSSCPSGVFELRQEALGSSGTVVAVNKRLCTFCRECVERAKELGAPDLVQVKECEEIFNFTVESTGALPAWQIVERGLEVLREKLDQMECGLQTCATN
eukprot:GHVR01108795.1.p1 GENE.GHVR01108795.1~~GHVR01108795.1.p1  ORF type:complete len:311 (-),score=77.31 GHVR01108795.1:243-1175(-)